MQTLNVILDVCAVAVALGAGAAFAQVRGRLRNTEAERRALQARLEAQEKAGPGGHGAAAVAPVDTDSAPPIAPLSETARLLEAANQRLLDLEQALLRAEKEQALSAQRVQAMEESLAARPARTILASENATSGPPKQPRPKVGLPSVRAASSEAANASAPSPVIVLLATSREKRATEELEQPLTAAGYQVIRAASVAGVISAARESHPHLITLDARLAGGDSLLALGKIKADAALREIPVVVVCPLKDRDHAVELGAAGCIAAPVAPNVLLATVKTALMSQRKRAERSRLAKAASEGGAGSVSAAVPE
ncbi:MAG: hypothetical protein H7Z41_09730 [Cytophagales bacterium]|nr:hypothetical protein [Armatimonadota bacterium]